MCEAVIIVGGPQKGTRFRPLSLDVAKPLFPVAGFPLIYHLVKACCEKVPRLKSLSVIGSFQPDSDLAKYMLELNRQFSSIPIRYLCEYAPLGTAGGLYHFRDRLTIGRPESILFINGDIWGDLPLDELFRVHESSLTNVILVTEVSESESTHYGCVVVDNDDLVKHYVEKPSSFVSGLISCGVYVFRTQSLMEVLSEVLAGGGKSTGDCNGQSDCVGHMDMETDVLPILVGRNQLKAHRTHRDWGVIKLPSSVLIANEHYLAMYGKGDKHQETVMVDPSASVHESAVLGPNVYVGKDCVVESGVRIRQSILLDGCVVKQNACVLNSILSYNVQIGKWARIEGLLDSGDLVSDRGDSAPHLGYRLASQSINVLGSGVRVSDELIVRNVIALPHKELTKSCRDQVVL